MTSRKLPRLRHFENSPNQRHIVGDDRYLYASKTPCIRLNVIGTGTIGQEHMQVAALLGRASVQGIYDESERSMTVAVEEMSKRGAGPIVQHKNLEAACNDTNADALMVCTPNHTHIDVLEIAARSGKPIFLEKPMATTLADARRIVEIASGYGSFIQVGLQYRYKAPYIEARHETLARRSLGEVRTISMSEYRPPFLDKVEQWNKFAEFSGGTLIEKCCHYFDIINMLAESTAVRVFASGGQAVNFTDFSKDGRAADIDDHAMVIVEYASGLRASFTLNMFAPHFHEELIVCGDEGRLVATETFNFLQSDVAQSRVAIEKGESGASRITELGYPRIVEQSGHHGSTFFEHIAFMDQIEGKATDSATPLQGLWSIIVAAAAQQSLRSGQPVDIETLLREYDLDAVLNPGISKEKK